MEVKIKKSNWKNYLFAFFITAIIFSTALFFNNYFNQKRITEIRTIHDKIAIDILSSEINFSLLAETTCKSNSDSILSNELNTLAEKLSYMENNLGIFDPQVLELKKYYSLLEIKDYLLMKRVNEKCGFKPIVIFYFYSNKGDCDECAKIGYVLTHLGEKYPQLRIYSFDFNLDLSAINTLIAINGIKNELPAIMVDNKVYYGFKDIEEIEKLLPELKQETENPIKTD